MDVHKMVTRKNRIVQKLTQGISGLFKKNKIEWLQGHGRLLKDNQVQVTPVGQEPSQEYTISARYIIIATGSVSTRFADAPR